MQEFNCLYESILKNLSVVEEAEKQTLIEISNKASEFRDKAKKSKTPQEKQQVIQQLVVLRKALIDEINSDLPEQQKKKTKEEIDETIQKLLGNPQFEGLRHLLSTLLKTKW